MKQKDFVDEVLRVISVEEASQIVLESAKRRRLSTVQTYGVSDQGPIVLAEDLRADRDLPPFNRVMMDGIAIQLKDFEEGCRSFEVIETLVPGSSPQQKLLPRMCFEVMTGAALPEDADTVVRYEDLIRHSGDPLRFTIRSGVGLHRGLAVHPRGSDCRADELVLGKGQVMGSAQWAVASSIGKTAIQGRGAVKVTLLATGDELVGVQCSPGPFQVRVSNPDAMIACLKGIGCEVSRPILVGDDPEMLSKHLVSQLPGHDIVVLSGAVSAGKFDHVPQVLGQLGVQKRFHQVAQRPGKPFWFGESEQGLVFAMPGNPVSVLTCLLRYLCPAVSEMRGLVRPIERIPLENSLDLPGKGNWTRFLPAIRRFNENGESVLRALPANTSGDLVQIARAHGLMECGPEKDHYEAGTPLPFYPFDLGGSYAYPS